eukprot:14351642-Alexandrium_andersonii.AAC.1
MGRHPATGRCAPSKCRRIAKTNDCPASCRRPQWPPQRPAGGQRLPGHPEAAELSMLHRYHHPPAVGAPAGL